MASEISFGCGTLTLSTAQDTQAHVVRSQRFHSMSDEEKKTFIQSVKNTHIRVRNWLDSHWRAENHRLPNTYSFENNGWQNVDEARRFRRQHKPEISLFRTLEKLENPEEITPDTVAFKERFGALISLIQNYSSFAQDTQALVVRSQCFHLMSDEEKKTFIQSVKNTHLLVTNWLNERWRGGNHRLPNTYSFENNGWQNVDEARLFRRQHKQEISLLHTLEKLENPEEITPDTVAFKERFGALISQIQNYSSMDVEGKRAYVESVVQLVKDVDLYLVEKTRQEKIPYGALCAMDRRSYGEAADKFLMRNQALLSLLPILNIIKYPEEKVHIEVVNEKTNEQKPIELTIATAKFRDIKYAAATAFEISPDSIQVVAFNNEKNEERPLREFIDKDASNVAHIGTN